MAYVFRHETKTPPKRGVSVTTIPAEFVDALNEQWKVVQNDGTIVPVIDFTTPQEVAMHLAYAKAWGLSRPEGEKVTVKKATAHKDDPATTLRLDMTVFDPDAPKRGRKPAAAK